MDRAADNRRAVEADDVKEPAGRERGAELEVDALTLTDRRFARQGRVRRDA
jgi:hypothetical protein